MTNELCIHPRCHMMREHTPDECGWPIESQPSHGGDPRRSEPLPNVDRRIDRYEAGIVAWLRGAGYHDAANALAELHVESCALRNVKPLFFVEPAPSSGEAHAAQTGAGKRARQLTVTDPSSARGRELIYLAGLEQPATQGDPPPNSPEDIEAHPWKTKSATLAEEIARRAARAVSSEWSQSQIEYEIEQLVLSASPSEPITALVERIIGKHTLWRSTGYYCGVCGADEHKPECVVGELETALRAASAVEHIWCEQCQAVVPLVRHYMPANRLHDYAATDLLCGECRFVIATLHHLEDHAAPPVKEGQKQ